MYKLRYAGDQDQAAFKEACNKHDFWYHSFYFDNGFEVLGDYNIGLNIHEYGFPEDMTGMKVLDVGTGSGWFAHYFWERGAEVTTVDARGYCDFDVRGRHFYPPVEDEKVKPDRIGEDGKAIYYSPVSGGFWVMKDLLGSDIRYVNSRVYDLHPDLFGGDTFDLVFMGALLVHLRDPVGALMSARKVCAGRVMTTTPIIEDGRREPQMYLIETPDPVSWWRPNLACYRHWFLEAGFPQADVSRSVKLTAEPPISSPHFTGPRNPAQILRVGNATIEAATTAVVETPSSATISASEFGWESLEEFNGKVGSDPLLSAQSIGSSLASEPAEPREPASTAATEEVDRLLLHGPDVEMPTSLGVLGRSMRRLVLRIIRNYQLHQQEVGQALLKFVRMSLADLEARGAELDAKIQELRSDTKSSHSVSVTRIGEELRRLAGDCVSVQADLGDRLAKMEASVARLEGQDKADSEAAAV